MKQRIAISAMKSGKVKVNRPSIHGLLIMFQAALILLSSCNKNQELNFSPDFNYSMQEGNLIHFTNQSDGTYTYMTWDFGNGEMLTTLDKNKEYDIYYPKAGTYIVSLKLSDALLNSDTVFKEITIQNDDLIVSFSTEADQSDPYKIKLVNTSIGTYDSLAWRYRNREVTEIDPSVYLPFSGSYEIILDLFKYGNIYSVSKTLQILQDDPQYFNKLELSWADEFDGPLVNAEYWTYETGATGWGNNELQEYTNGNNAEIMNGILILTAKKINENKDPGSYTSARITTKNKKEFTYGRMEISARLPSGTGIWPAIWMLGSNISTADWPACGEIDIMEYVGFEPNTIHSTIHTTSGYRDNGSGSSKILASCEEEFHVYGILWTERKITFYIDSPSNITHTYNPPVKNENTWPFDLPQFFILNVAVGGDWGGAQGVDNAIFPQSMELDWLRVYQEPE